MKHAGPRSLPIFFKKKTAYEILALTGVKTCALPISVRSPRLRPPPLPDGSQRRRGPEQPVRIVFPLDPLQAVVHGGEVGGGRKGARWGKGGRLGGRPIL